MRLQILLSRSSAVLEAEIKHAVISAFEAGALQGESGAFMCCAFALSPSKRQVTKKSEQKCAVVRCMYAMVRKTVHQGQYAQLLKAGVYTL
jgi:hypothetical protein